MRKHLKTVLIVCGTLLISGAATAGAASIISGKHIEKGSIPLNRLTKGTQHKITGTIPFKRLSKGTQTLIATKVPGPKGDKGDRGATGATGAPGAPGAPGATGSVTYSGAHWGLIDRNVIGSPVGALRSGPYEGDSTPPMGDGSLGLSVKDSTEKVAFGNEVDFVGDRITDVSAIGFSVFWTGEDKAIYANNLPNITFEVDPSGADSTDAPNYSSLVFDPDGSSLATNVFSDIDATDSSAGGWYFTNGTTASTTGCTQGSMCSFDDLQTAVGDNYPDMSVLTLAVAKGRDYAFNGAVDALAYNTHVYDFEPFGVTTTTP